jgi:Uma2 family endonuclease
VDEVSVSSNWVLPDTSIDRDRAKLSVYARAGVRETWLANLETDRLEVYRRPTADGYRDTRVVGRGEPITIEALPDVTLTVDDLLG